ncbi:BON domain-containing protein [Paraburkholderia rhizosphaerae]|uniref:BON domain-containing protein n=1 Tax=Paraburkholderia rhizosphaerae TaxID=480658 RepID=A0A4R8LJG1_9BURK|nr:BON domain-containing protein [Paraburkholderia rhizosphaerae]TDY43945.1 BON domain-containing protein [Paraburkholderia rhizosphaerae]
MKISEKLVCTVGALMLVGSIHAWPQGGDDAKMASGGAAASAPGVASRKSAKQADRALRKKVYAAIAKYKAIDAGDISISAKSGVVTLYGTVKDASQVNQVAEIARNVPGVTSVVNKLAVTRPFSGQ